MISTAEKTKEVIKFKRLDNPFVSLAEISRQVGVSKQYVYQILVQNGIPTLRAKMQHYTICKVCDQRIENSLAKVHKGRCHGLYYFSLVHCYNCNVTWHMRRSVYLQKEKRGDKHIYCSRSCYFEDRFQK